MLRPWAKIKIGERSFNYCTSFKCSSAWDKFTDTGELIIPSKVKLDGETITIGDDNVFHRGDPITIQSGYFPKIQPVFSGFVSKIFPDLPLKIVFEDATWILKQTNVTFGLKSCTLKQMITTAIEEAKKNSPANIKAVLSRLTLDVVDANIGSFRVTNCNLVQVLEELKKTYALTSYFRDNTLHVGLAYPVNGASYTYTFEENIIEPKLEYTRADDVKIKVKAISMLPNNTKIEVEVGDEGGEQRTMFKYNLTKDQLRAVALREKDKFKYEGWRGTFKTFLTDIVKHGDRITIINKRLPEWNGTYYAAAVEPEGGVGGQFQTITLGAKISVSGNNF